MKKLVNGIISKSPYVIIFFLSLYLTIDLHPSTNIKHLQENGFIVHDEDYIPKLNKFEGQYYPLMWIDSHNLIVFKVSSEKQFTGRRYGSEGYKGNLYKLNVKSEELSSYYKDILWFDYCSDGESLYIKKDTVDVKPSEFRHVIKLSKNDQVSDIELNYPSRWELNQDYWCNASPHRRGYNPHSSISSTAEHNKFIKTDGDYFVVPSFNGNKLKHPVLPRRETDTNSFKYVVQNKNGEEVFNRYVKQPIWANLTSWDCFSACTKSSHVSLVKSGLVFNVTDNSLGRDYVGGVPGVYYMGFYDNKQKLLAKGHRFWNLIISDDGCSIAFKGYKDKDYSHSEVLRNAMDNLFYFNVCTK